MKFESLELLGFKSFADKSRVVFDNHVTAIVGPNGCGKSNLSDALGWVLGVQTAQGLRGQKMEDLIFNGTRKRQP
ncbi:MAG: AAA family ATPase, partial [Acidobacteriota bacterium]